MEIGRVTAVVLAAGAGSRFGGGKLLASIDGRPVLQHVVDRLVEAGIEDLVVVLGADADAIDAAIDWGPARRVRNPDPGRGLSSSLRVGLDAVGADAAAVVIALGDQPRVAAGTLRALLEAARTADPDRTVVVPVYPDDRGRNPVVLARRAFALADEATGDRGLGPILAAHPESVLEVPVAGANPDIDTRAGLVELLEASWAARVRDNRDQVDRFREVPDGPDFYGPVSALFRADPTRTDEPALEVLRSHVRPGETWLDIGAGAGRYALPIAAALAPSAGSVVAIDPSIAMLDALREIAAEHAITNVRVVEGRWPLDHATASTVGTDVSLIAHVGYDIEAIGPFLAAMEGATRSECLAVLMERQPSSIADVFWPPVHGEPRVALPALPEFVELLDAMGRAPHVERLHREPRRFGDPTELEGFLRRQLWIEPGGAKDARFREALASELETDALGRVGLRGQRPLPIGIVAWVPRSTGDGG